MGRNNRKLLILPGLLLLAVFVFSQDEVKEPSDRGSPPETIRRPERSEFPRYPEDLVIGSMGQGNSNPEAYKYARQLLQELTAGNNDSRIIADSLSILGENTLEEIKELGAKSYRIGGGRTEPDGSVSFLVRFIGSDESVTGEMFLRQEDKRQNEDTKEAEKWMLDDLILEDKKTFSETKESYRFDFSPYERFF